MGQAALRLQVDAAARAMSLSSGQAVRVIIHTWASERRPEYKCWCTPPNTHHPARSHQRRWQGQSVPQPLRTMRDPVRTKNTPLNMERRPQYNPSTAQLPQAPGPRRAR
jgi:hypothetical protein